MPGNIRGRSRTPYRPALKCRAPRSSSFASTKLERVALEQFHQGAFALESAQPGHDGVDLARLDVGDVDAGIRWRACQLRRERARAVVAAGLGQAALRFAEGCLDDDVRDRELRDAFPERRVGT